MKIHNARSWAMGPSVGRSVGWSVGEGVGGECGGTKWLLLPRSHADKNKTTTPLCVRININVSVFRVDGVDGRADRGGRLDQ